MAAMCKKKKKKKKKLDRVGILDVGGFHMFNFWPYI